MSDVEVSAALPLLVPLARQQVEETLHRLLQGRLWLPAVFIVLPQSENSQVRKQSARKKTVKGALA